MNASGVGSKLPFLAAAVGVVMVVARFFKGKKGGAHTEVYTEAHRHEALDHEHEHVHVTHNRTDPEKGVGGWEHLTATHSHRHNHAAMEHVHRPHRHFDAEHRMEAHVHSHEHPIEDAP
jgi:hypothetical protein